MKLKFNNISRFEKLITIIAAKSFVLLFGAMAVFFVLASLIYTMSLIPHSDNILAVAAILLTFREEIKKKILKFF